MKPRQRRTAETLFEISLDNIIINNVNHLKEYLMTNQIPHSNFSQLVKFVRTNGLPQALIQYADEKGVVVSERMQEIIEVNENEKYSS